jgi:hypothetical protein
VEELIPKVTEALDVRLKEIKEQLIQIKEDMGRHHGENAGQFASSVTTIAGMIGEISK